MGVVSAGAWRHAARRVCKECEFYSCSAGGRAKYIHSFIK